MQSRYYNPDMGRFLNADGIIGEQGELLGHNLFVYCNNNPVNLCDPNGDTPIQAVFAAIGAIAGWHFGDYVAKRLGYKKGYKYWAIRSGVTVGGAVIGWFAGGALANIAKRFLMSNSAVLNKTPKFVLRFLNMAGPSGILYNNINKAVSNVIPNTIRHIMQSKHAWNLVGRNNWSSVSNTIQYVLRNGSGSVYKAGNIIYTARYKGQNVQVITRMVNGTMRIVDAWVKTK